MTFLLQRIAKEKLHFICCVLLLCNPILSFAQGCPAGFADLEDGGTFSGNCTVSGVGLALDLNGNVTWLSGTLTIEGTTGVGNIIVHNGFTLTVSGGTIQTDNSDGRLEVQTGGTVTVAAGAAINVSTGIRISGGTLTVDGSLTTTSSQLDIFPGGNVTINSTGVITTGGTGDNVIQGSLNMSGILSTNGDFEVDGGNVTVANGGTLNVGNIAAPVTDNDLLIYNSGSVTIAVGATLNVDDDVINASGSPPTAAGIGTLVINGALNAGDNLTLNNTTTNSSLTSSGTGSITVAGSFSDGECPYASGYTFCNCAGGGVTCSAVLPVELVSFDAMQNGNTIQLNWITATEISNHYFTLQRLTPSDSFEDVSIVPGHGTSLEQKTYQALDSNPTEGLNYYRLKQTDFDGATEYFDLISVSFHRQDFPFTIYPNPTTSGNFTLVTSGQSPSKRVNYSIHSASGVFIQSGSMQTNEIGEIDHAFQIENNSGICILEIEGRHFRVIVK
jgi:hypothetical protein